MQNKNNKVKLNADTFTQILPDTQEVSFWLGMQQVSANIRVLTVDEVFEIEGVPTLIKDTTDLQQRKNKSADEIQDFVIKNDQLMVNVIYAALVYEEGEDPLSKEQIKKMPDSAKNILYNAASGNNGQEVAHARTFPEEASEQG